VAARVTSQFWEIGDIVDVLEAFENSRAADELQRSAMSRQVSTGRGNANSTYVGRTEGALGQSPRREGGPSATMQPGEMAS
jgi:hypothetical protein